MYYAYRNTDKHTYVYMCVVDILYIHIYTIYIYIYIIYMTSIYTLYHVYVHTCTEAILPIHIYIPVVSLIE